MSVCLSAVLKLTSGSQDFMFEDIEESASPVPSVLRGFSAPVRLVIDQSDEDLSLLMAHDTDSFNKWEAGDPLMPTVVCVN